MARLKIRYLVCRPNQNGSPRYYWQPDKTLRTAGWKMRRLSDNQSEAIVEAQDINQAVDNWRIGALDNPSNDKPGSVRALIQAYKKSREYKDKADKTRKDYDRYLRLIEDWAGTEPAVMINAKMVQDLYEMIRKKKPRKAMYIVQVLRLLFAYAERQSIIPKNSNPATRPAMDYKAEKGTIWTSEAVRDFVATADTMGFFDVGTAIMLNEWLGQRQGDLLSIRMAAYKDGAIHIRQSKTGAEVTLPVDMVPVLKERIEIQIAHNTNKSARTKTSGLTLIQQINGKPYTKDGFMSAFERIRIEATKKNPTIKTMIFKDLRHTAVTRLSEAGASIQQIAAVTGHSFKSCQDIVDRYNIRTTKMAKEAFSLRMAAEWSTSTINRKESHEVGKTN
ncbi:MAG: tyrosine-type recombinase/integrase [Alphaproteobacteria bacterium]|nr:tyrosine-type recombinase/integrase [Alphaproteobacteria bacterium]